VPRGDIRLGLRENWKQFTLLVVVNAFVGAMVGMERAVLPLLAEKEFGLASRAAALSFLVSFGIAKAISNLFAGRMSDRFGRRRVLVAGWLFGVPVPILIAVAPSWDWVVFANVLLAVNQGLCWSTTVIMKIDLAGPARRGLAMGLNEAAGYLAVSVAALASGYLAAAYALRPHPFYIGMVVAAAGLVSSAFLVRETQGHARYEASLNEERGRDRRALFAASQAGLVNNLNDGAAWGLFPLYFSAAGLQVQQVGWLAAMYPAVWGLGQIGTGILSDRVGRKRLIVGGMWVQGAAIFLIMAAARFRWWALGSVLLGVGTAMVYPTLLASVGESAQPEQRASAVGIYRLWRDAGYAVGALLAGALADWFGMRAALGAVAALTLLSGVVAAATLPETLRGR